MEDEPKVSFFNRVTIDSCPVIATSQVLYLENGDIFMWGLNKVCVYENTPAGNKRYIVGVKMSDSELVELYLNPYHVVRVEGKRIHY